MNKAKVLVLGGLIDDALDDLRSTCEVTVGPVGHRPNDDRQWVLKNIAKYDGVIVAKMIFDKEIIDAAKNLKVISTYGVGFDHRIVRNFFTWYAVRIGGSFFFLWFFQK